MNLTLVVTYGRTGSTLLMRILRQHPQVLVRGPFPFEVRTAQYLYLAQRLGIEPLGRPLCYGGATYYPASNRDEIFRGIALEAVNSARFPASMSMAYNDISEAENRTGATVIAEKAIGLLLASEMLDAYANFRLISLVRNPQTTVRSIQAFNRRRGFVSFGEEAGPELLLDRIIAFNLAALGLAEKFAGRSLVARYEDLMDRPAWVAEELLKLHGLPEDPSVVERMAGVRHYEDDLTRAHRTSGATEDVFEDQALSQEQADQMRLLGY